MNIKKMMKQMQALQEKMAKSQEEFNNKEFEITAGGGAIKITILGSFEIKNIEIDPDAITPDDKEGLEDLMVSAFNQAIQKVKEELNNETSKIMGSMGLPTGIPGLGL